MNIHIIPGYQLSAFDRDAINKAKAREFHVLPMDAKQLNNSIFFLLKKKYTLLATGQLVEIPGVKIGDTAYDIQGIGGIVANVKLRGYGGMIMEAMKAFITDNHRIAVGFCRNINREFYLKCGLGVDCTLVPRLVYYKGNKKITNTTDHCVVYYDLENTFIKQFQVNPKRIAVLPRYPDW